MAHTTEPSGDPSEVIVGAHTVRFELPDVVFAILVGDVSVDDYLGLLRANEQFAEGKPWTLLLVDMRRMGVILPAARKIAVKLPTSIRGNSIFGASLTMRVLTALQAKVIQLISPERASPVVAFETEAEARAWIIERRRTLASPAGGSSARRP